MSTWDIKNSLAVLEKGAFEYATRLDALYEFLKNHAEADAYHIYTDIDTRSHSIVISGDGRGLCDTEILKEVCSVAQSQKDLSHHGLGQIHAFLRLASKFTFISKKDGEMYLVNCVPLNDRLEDEIPPRKMQASDYTFFARHTGRLSKWTHGTVIVLEGVGKRQTKGHDFTFNMKEEFEEKSLVKKLQEKLQEELDMRKFFLKIDDQKSVRIPAKIGTGKKIAFIMPSKGYAVSNNRENFDYLDRKFNMTLTFNLRMSTSKQTEPIWLSQEGKDNISLDAAFRDRRGISHTVFYSSQYSSYLSGHVSFKVKALDKDQLPSFYTGSRQSIITDSTFGKCLANLLIEASVNYIQPLMQQYIDEKQSSKDERRSHTLTDDLSSFFRLHSELASQIFQMNEGLVPTSKTKCRGCSLTAEPTRVSLDQINKGPWDDKYIYLCGDMYRCGNCGAIWEREHRGPNDKKPTHKPIYEPPKPDPGESKDRVKKRGYGYSCVVIGFLGDTSNRWKLDKSHEILINSRHIGHCISYTFRCFTSVNTILLFTDKTHL